jgi:hypothetical protein
MAVVAGIRLRAFVVAVLAPLPPLPSLTSSRVWLLGASFYFLVHGARQIRGRCTGGAPISTNAEDLFMHPLRVLLLLLLLLRVSLHLVTHPRGPLAVPCSTPGTGPKKI